MAHGDAREGKWRGKMWMEWVASSLAVYVGTRSIQLLSADPHSLAASSRLNWRPRRFKWTRPFCWKTKSGFCACAITFRTCYTMLISSNITPNSLILFSTSPVFQLWVSNSSESLCCTCPDFSFVSVLVSLALFHWRAWFTSNPPTTDIINTVFKI